MNSFRFLERGVRTEIERQVALLDGGEPVVQETLHFDPAFGSPRLLRSKEEAHDYRYFPEPDLVPLLVSEAERVAIERSLPELPATRAAVRDRARPTRARPGAGLPARARRLLRAALLAAVPATPAASSSRQLDPAARRADRLGRRPGRQPRDPAGVGRLAAMVVAKEVSRDAARGPDQAG